ncbi:MAG TPA: VWA domain-containing protein [Pyrinomonadaceae bacterium]|jgi:VWFA-related protein
MRFFRSCASLSIFCSLFSLAISAQIPNPPTPENQDNEVVKISTNLIQIDATVTDKNGIAVTNLTTDDFELLQDGKPQKLVNLTYVKPSSVKKAAPNDPANQFSKQIPVSVRAAPGRIITFVIDDGNCLATPEGIDSARQTTLAFIEGQMLPDDKVALYRTRGGSSLLQIYTSDKNVLKRAVERVKWKSSACGSSFDGVQNNSTARHIYGPHGNDFLNDPNVGSNVDSFESEADKEIRKMLEAGERAAQAAGTIGVLGFVVERLKNLPQRKLVFLLSEGISGDQNPEALKKISDQASRASVVIYTITGKSMTNSGLFEARDDVSLDPRNSASEEGIRQERIDEERSLNAGLSFLAETTGGRFIRNKARPEAEIERILDAETGYYLLGYEPEDETFKGKEFHKIEVKLKRRPELAVAARRGFYGALLKNEDKKPRAKAADGETSLYQALISPVLENEIRLRLTALYENKENHLRVLFHLKGEDLTLVDDSNGMKKVVLDAVGIVFDEAGRVVDEFNQTYPIRIPKNGIRTVTQSGLDFSRDFKIKKPGVHSVRFMVRDRNSRRLGTAADYVEVPDFKKGKFLITNLVTTEITKSGKPFVAKMRPNEAAFAPVFFQTMPSVRRYYRGTVMAYTYTIGNPRLDEALKIPKLTIQVRLYKNGKLLTALKETPVELERRSDWTSIDDFGFLKLKEEISAGEYVLQMVVRDVLAGKTASQWIDFEVIQ